MLSCREHWTGWHRIHAHMMISSQSLYPTVTRMETSMLNRSVTHNDYEYTFELLLKYWAIWTIKHYYWANTNKNTYLYTSNNSLQTLLAIFGQKQNMPAAHKILSCQFKINTKCVSKLFCERVLMPGPYFSKHTKSDLLSQRVELCA